MNEVHSAKEREIMLVRMEAAAGEFYSDAMRIGNHPFIEFTGLMNEYINMCRAAHEAGIDFTQCNKHAGYHLPMLPHQVNYVNEKLGCIFTGREASCRKAALEEACAVVYGHCENDNVAQRTVDAIRKLIDEDIG